MRSFESLPWWTKVPSWVCLICDSRRSWALLAYSSQTPETIHHILSYCVLSMEFWVWLLRTLKLGMVPHPNSSSHFWAWWCKATVTLPKDFRKGFSSLFILVGATEAQKHLRVRWSSTSGVGSSCSSGWWGPHVVFSWDLKPKEAPPKGGFCPLSWLWSRVCGFRV
jgi:hypothetical protein